MSDFGDIFSLQRSAGNAAVSNFIHRSAELAARADEEVERNTEAEQPMTIHKVLRSTGERMSPDLREEMETRFGDGADFSGVRFHTGREAAHSANELQAQAYTVKNHVVFNQGFDQDKKVVAHELAHYVENKKGSAFKSVPYGGDVSVSEVDGPSEVAADATAERVMSAPAPSAESGSNSGPTVSRKEADSCGSAHSDAVGVQRALKVGDRDFTAEYNRKISTVAPNFHQQVLMQMTDEVTYFFNNQAANDFLPQERAKFANEAQRIKWQLAKIIVNPIGAKNYYHPVLQGIVGKNQDFGRKNHDIQVNNYTELARNLMGWVYAKDNRRREKNNAQAMHVDVNLDRYLNVLLRRMYRYTKAVQETRMMDDREIHVMKKELKTGLAHVESQRVENGKRDPDGQAGRPVGAYITHFDGGINPAFRGTHLDAKILERGGLYEVMKEPENFKLREKMIALHDLSEYFGHSRHTPPTKGKEAVPEINAQDSQSTTGFDHRGRRVTSVDRGQNPLLHANGAPKVNDRGEPKTHASTRNENSPTTTLARSRDRPVWAGQSYTAARMFKMAASSGASPEEIAALGWGIFAFWRTDFDHTTQFAYHTLHEVMDIAQNFGVPYNIDDPYGSYSQLDLKHVGDKMTRLHSGVAELRAQADYNAQGMESLKHDRRRMWTDRDDELLNAFLSISRSAERLEEKISRRGHSFNQQDQMPGRERSILLTKIIDEMAGWQDSMSQIQSNLARQSRRV
ncbi:DUF4157 domain-containing protein [Streptomyces clavifer]|uniref:eCIS core domain-containing protein n=1 Tax=Streptomyces clavifer TaxID=68188 RepID=UPI002E80768D|nr:DUF4157 domain-containing protein [Streptomyces clavifer]WUC28358.1 DUF4157 domain-containing protein [Streptomyces clavifer]